MSRTVVDDCSLYINVYQKIPSYSISIFSYSITFHRILSYIGPYSNEQFFWLVVWNIFVFFHSVGNDYPTHIFRWGFSSTTNQSWFFKLPALFPWLSNCWSWCQWISWRENLIRKPARFSHEIWDVPVIFPLNQSIDNGLICTVLEVQKLQEELRTAQAATAELEVVVFFFSGGDSLQSSARWLAG